MIDDYGELFLHNEDGIPKNVIKVEEIRGLSKLWFYLMVLLQFVTQKIDLSRFNMF